ncbi:MAG: copper-binding protein [Amphiplicatus sp.]
MKSISSVIAAAAFISAMSILPVNAAQDPHPMEHDAMMDHDSHCGMPAGEGAINTLDVAKSRVNISHGPIEALGWPQMKMDFSVSNQVDLAAFSAGERVHFMLKAEKDKSYSIAMMCSLEADAGTHEACMGKMHEIAMKTAESEGATCSMEGMSDMKRMNHDDGAEQDHKGHH